MPLSEVTCKSHDNNFLKNRHALKKLLQEEKWWNDLSLGHSHLVEVHTFLLNFITKESERGVN